MRGRQCCLAIVLRPAWNVPWDGNGKRSEITYNFGTPDEESGSGRLLLT